MVVLAQRIETLVIVREEQPLSPAGQEAAVTLTPSVQVVLMSRNDVAQVCCISGE